MKNLIKNIVIGSLILFVSMEAQNTTQGIEGLIEKKRKQEILLTGKTTDEWLEDQKQKMKFDRAEWENLKKKRYQSELKKKQENIRYQNKSKKYIELSSKFSSVGLVYDRFKREKANSYILKHSKQREEIKKYLEELKREYEIADKEFTEYLREGGK